jgi:hypothetical protein
VTSPLCFPPFLICCRVNVSRVLCYYGLIQKARTARYALRHHVLWEEQSTHRSSALTFLLGFSLFLVFSVPTPDNAFRTSEYSSDTKKKKK